MPAGEGCLGRLIDVLGHPLDGGDPLPQVERCSVIAPPPLLVDTVPGQQILPTGVKVIDLLCPFVRGGKTGLFGGAGVGKTVLMMEFMHAVSSMPSDRLAVVSALGSANSQSPQPLHERHALGREPSTVVIKESAAYEY